MLCPWRILTLVSTSFFRLQLTPELVAQLLTGNPSHSVNLPPGITVQDVARALQGLQSTRPAADTTTDNDTSLDVVNTTDDSAEQPSVPPNSPAGQRPVIPVATVQPAPSVPSTDHDYAQPQPAPTDTLADPVSVPGSSIAQTSAQDEDSADEVEITRVEAAPPKSSVPLARPSVKVSLHSVQSRSRSHSFPPTILVEVLTRGYFPQIDANWLKHYRDLAEGKHDCSSDDDDELGSQERSVSMWDVV